LIVDVLAAAARLGLAAGLLLTLACSPNAEADASRTLVLDGRMDAEMLARVSAVRWTDYDAIKFSSPGGDLAVSVPIARALKNSGKPIEIDGICASSCLMVAVIGDGRVSFSSASSLLGHNTASSGYYMALRKYPRIASSRYYEGMLMERAWLLENQIDPRLLLAPQFMLETPCVTGPAEDDPKLGDQLNYISKFGLWSIPEETAAAFGLEARGWKASATDVSNLFRSLGRTVNAALINDEPVPPEMLTTSEKDLASILYSIELCEP
jgi:hypothetical protein